MCDGVKLHAISFHFRIKFDMFLPFSISVLFRRLGHCRKSYCFHNATRRNIQWFIAKRSASVRCTFGRRTVTVGRSFAIFLRTEVAFGVHEFEKVSNRNCRFYSIEWLNFGFRCEFQLDDTGLWSCLPSNGLPRRPFLELGRTIGQFRFAFAVRTPQLSRCGKCSDRMRLEYDSNWIGRLRLSQRHRSSMSAGARNIDGSLARHSIRVSRRRLCHFSLFEHELTWFFSFPQERIVRTTIIANE